MIPVQSEAQREPVVYGPAEQLLVSRVAAMAVLARKRVAMMEKNCMVAVEVGFEVGSLRFVCEGY